MDLGRLTGSGLLVKGDEIRGMCILDVLRRSRFFLLRNRGDGRMGNLETRGDSRLRRLRKDKVRRTTNCKSLMVLKTLARIQTMARQMR
jgi:hypothetical protein